MARAVMTMGTRPPSWPWKKPQTAPELRTCQRRKTALDHVADALQGHEPGHQPFAGLVGGDDGQNDEDRYGFFFCRCKGLLLDGGGAARAELGMTGSVGASASTQFQQRGHLRPGALRTVIFSSFPGAHVQGGDDQDGLEQLAVVAQQRFVVAAGCRPRCRLPANRRCAWRRGPTRSPSGCGRGWP